MADEPEYPSTDAGYQPDDAPQDGEDLTVEDAAGFVADVRENWHALDAADQEQAAEAAGALLDEVGAQLRDAGYDDAKFYEAFTQSGGDLRAALAVAQALGDT